ncbi:glycosyltransferase involved in cell wall biosynthesis [Loktanella ponticola]|uniref:Glycosyltransferase involved in cell wall biosynthesis n=1 Tax=Yoonia ponticola TaxID=1524255 RepID=A0A7W9BNU4_9RHOB|nr:DUF1972 domain-containing protein [Yoonia ponticola]MBB5723918.1 glycosyltransferase involved in cell wall biosynthesis [Yoonia ponticola]
MKRAIIGTVGVPGRYGGFETLAENLVHYHTARIDKGELTVYCSAGAYPARPAKFSGATLRYSRLRANGLQSVLYDIVTALDAVRRGDDVLLVLGVSGAVVLPLIRLIAPRRRIVTNIDGIEWKREKWQGIAKRFLRWSEKLAVRWSHVVVADNHAIAEYVRDSYGTEVETIAYGGDHAVAEAIGTPDAALLADLPAAYTLALCRIEPENNVAMILEAFADTEEPLVFVGNWSNSHFGRDLKQRYCSYANITLLDPVYDPATLQAIRAGARAYAHGHSAGGTNPSLVEMMHFGVPVHAFDCSFNRHTTENEANYFSTAQKLAQLAGQPLPKQGMKMLEIAKRNYTWQIVCKRYFELMDANTRS